MNSVTASSHHALAGKPNFRLRIATAQRLQPARAARPIMPKTTYQRPRGNRISPPIVGPPPIIVAPAAPTRDADPTNPHRP